MNMMVKMMMLIVMMMMMVIMMSANLIQTCFALFLNHLDAHFQIYFVTRSTYQSAKHEGKGLKQIRLSQTNSFSVFGVICFS